MDVQEVLEERCWTISGLLTRDECREIIEHGTSHGIQTKPASGDVRHRNSCKLPMHDPRLASLLWRRLRAVVPPTFDVRPGARGFAQDCAQDAWGRWHPRRINERFSLLYYRSGGHFGPHRDASVLISEHERSLLTLAIYLVDRPKQHGGATNFLSDDMACPPVDSKGRIRSPTEAVRVRVESDRAGKAVLFLHDLLHEGEALEVHREDGEVDHQALAEPKWILITQVMYERDPSTAPVFTDDQKEARRLLKDAEEAEVNGDVYLAMKKYNRAYKLDRSLENT